jgi:hypothetical protein
VASTKGTRVTLWLDADDPPAGRVQAASAPALPFEGWLELLARLSQVFDDVTDTPEQEQPS